jgi:hypothetical protein
MATDLYLIATFGIDAFDVRLRGDPCQTPPLPHGSRRPENNTKTEMEGLV